MVSVECGNCGGYCCKVMVVPAPKGDMLTPKRLNYIKTVKVGENSFHILESVCKFLKGGRCSVYDRRPQRCRDFPKGEKEMWRACHFECGMLSK